MRNCIIQIGCLLVFAMGCHNSSTKNQGNHDHSEHHGANESMNNRSFEELVQRFESPKRTAYQQPAKVIQFLGDISEDTIMDLGAGTGYFSFKMAMQNAFVIAADVDQRFLSYIEEKRTKLGLPEMIMETRKVPYDSPMLKKQEVHKVLIVNTYHHINDRPTYFAKVKAGLKTGGKLFVIDFIKKDDEFGPPKGMRIPFTQVITELEQAGFQKVQLHSDLLEHQYIITAE